MPRIIGVRERIDEVAVINRVVEPGQTTDNDITRYDDAAYAVAGIGLRLLGKSREQEDRLLDHLSVRFRIADRPYGGWPGTILSTRRQVYEAVEYEPPKKSVPDRLVRAARATMPGYILLRPIVVAVRMPFRVYIDADERLGQTVEARCVLFGLRNHEVV